MCAISCCAVKRLPTSPSVPAPVNAAAKKADVATLSKLAPGDAAAASAPAAALLAAVPTANDDPSPNSATTPGAPATMSKLPITDQCLLPSCAISAPTRKANGHHGQLPVASANRVGWL